MGALCRIAATDGGGTRDVVAAHVWGAIERRLHDSLHSRIDLFAGTSMGSVIACALSARISPAEIKAEIYSFAPTVFSTSAKKWLRLRWRHGLSAPKHDSRDLARSLRDFFGERRFGDLAAPTLVPAYEIGRGRMRVFDSTREVDAQRSVWEICTASCSAPTFFGGHGMAIDGIQNVFVDGGLGANNPTAFAIQHALASGHAPEDIFCVSVGTGYAPSPVSLEDAKEWGGLEWAPRIISHLMGANSDAMHKIAEGLLPKGSLVRLQCRLQPDQVQIDAYKKRELDGLVRTATRSTDAGPLRLLVNAAVRMLKT